MWSPVETFTMASLLVIGVPFLDGKYEDSQKPLQKMDYKQALILAMSRLKIKVEGNREKHEYEFQTSLHENQRIKHKQKLSTDARETQVSEEEPLTEVRVDRGAELENQLITGKQERNPFRKDSVEDLQMKLADQLRSEVSRKIQLRQKVQQDKKTELEDLLPTGVDHQPAKLIEQLQASKRMFQKTRLGNQIRIEIKEVQQTKVENVIPILWTRVEPTELETSDIDTPQFKTISTWEILWRLKIERSYGKGIEIRPGSLLDRFHEQDENDYWGAVDPRNIRAWSVQEQDDFLAAMDYHFGKRVQEKDAFLAGIKRILSKRDPQDPTSKTKSNCKQSASKSTRALGQKTIIKPDLLCEKKSLLFERSPTTKHDDSRLPKETKPKGNLDSDSDYWQPSQTISSPLLSPWSDQEENDFLATVDRYFGKRKKEKNAFLAAMKDLFRQQGLQSLESKAKKSPKSSDSAKEPGKGSGKGFMKKLGSMMPMGSPKQKSPSLEQSPTMKRSRSRSPEQTSPTSDQEQDSDSSQSSPRKDSSLIYPRNPAWSDHDEKEFLAAVGRQFGKKVAEKNAFLASIGRLLPKGSKAKAKTKLPDSDSESKTTSDDGTKAKKRHRGGYSLWPKQTPTMKRSDTLLPAPTSPTAKQGSDSDNSQSLGELSSPVDPSPFAWSEQEEKDFMAIVDRHFGKRNKEKNVFLATIRRRFRKFGLRMRKKPQSAGGTSNVPPSAASPLQSRDSSPVTDGRPFEGRVPGEEDMDDTRGSRGEGIIPALKNCNSALQSWSAQDEDDLLANIDHHFGNRPQEKNFIWTALQRPFRKRSSRKKPHLTRTHHIPPSPPYLKELQSRMIDNPNSEQQALGTEDEDDLQGVIHSNGVPALDSFESWKQAGNAQAEKEFLAHIDCQYGKPPKEKNTLLAAFQNPFGKKPPRKKSHSTKTDNIPPSPPSLKEIQSRLNKLETTLQSRKQALSGDEDGIRGANNDPTEDNFKSWQQEGNAQAEEEFLADIERQYGKPPKGKKSLFAGIQHPFRKGGPKRRSSTVVPVSYPSPTRPQSPRTNNRESEQRVSNQGDEDGRGAIPAINIPELADGKSWEQLLDTPEERDFLDSIDRRFGKTSKDSAILTAIKSRFCNPGSRKEP